MPKNSFPILVALLSHLSEFPDSIEMTFREDADRDNRFELSVESDDERLIAEIAKAFGAPGEDIASGETAFTNSDAYEGEISFRDFADEMTPRWGEFFDETVTLGELRGLAQTVSVNR